MTLLNEPDTIKVTVLDEPLRIASEADPEYTREVAAHVDRTLRALRDSAPTMEPFKNAVLGAMEITDDLLRDRSERAALAAELTGRIERLDALIDGALKQSVPDNGSGGSPSRRSRKETSAR
ncbi:MAG TPA: cell division protein ZapA [Gemmatimonadota bacterium]|nr:cell division protein ZapA [Gemmatimonadota bacterium]